MVADPHGSRVVSSSPLAAVPPSASARRASGSERSDSEQFDSERLSAVVSGVVLSCLFSRPLSVSRVMVVSLRGQSTHGNPIGYLFVRTYERKNHPFSDPVSQSHVQREVTRRDRK